MQATLDASSLKSFTKSLVCLSRYGDELSIYATPQFLSLSATNSSKSAYCRFKFPRQFFSKFSIGAELNGSSNEIEELPNVNGQLMAKSFLSILKHKTVEKSVIKCELTIIEGNDQPGDDTDRLESKLIVRLHCKHGVVKTHRLLLLTLTSLMAPVITDAENKSLLSMNPKALKDLIEHFPLLKGTRTDCQLIWTFDESEVGLRSVETSIDRRGRGQLQTELAISPEEFDVYDIHETPFTIAFHLREFNATIAFADSIKESLNLRFTDPTAPLFIELDGDAVESFFVISTSQVQGTALSQRSNSQPMNHRKRDRGRSETAPPRVKKPMKVVHLTDLEAVDVSSQATNRITGSMPPPTFIPDRTSQHQPSVNINLKAGSPETPKFREPLFLPSSQMSTADAEVLRSTGLGIEDMDNEELDNLLEGEGEEVNMTVGSPSQNSTGHQGLITQKFKTANLHLKLIRLLRQLFSP